ncbi:MAG: YopX family protein [Candidatus Paceibacterota bacterium]
MSLPTFRYWNDKTKEMVCPSQKNIHELRRFFEHIGHYIGYNQIHLMQYTGFLDKTDSKIFEGDILQIKMSNDIVSYCYLSEVKYITGFFGVYRYGSWFPMANLARPGDKLTILGNIYENPELIKLVETSRQK